MSTNIDFDAADDDDGDYPDDFSMRHEICDRCGSQMWFDEAGTAFRCYTCETEYE